MCLACYKSHLQVLKTSKPVSTNADLSAIISCLKTESIKSTNVKNLSDAINGAMQCTCIYVGEALLAEESMLLPSVHAFFLISIRELLEASNIHISDTEIENSVTARWILSNLTTTYKHHLNSVCKIKKHGTILYRRDGDILCALSKALHKLKTGTKCTMSHSPSTDESTSVHTETTVECMNS